MILKQSELILNQDGSVYHLNLKPEHLADTIITVGDPDRVSKVTRYFDTVEFKIQKREFHTQTGTYKGKRLTVISTGIGTDNIDIVFNELDALANINLETRTVNSHLKTLDFIRIGTSGAIQKEIPLDSFLISETAVGFDSLLHFYKSNAIQDNKTAEALVKHTHWHPSKSTPYVVNADVDLMSQLQSNQTIKGCTATNVGFYGPQGRVLRLAIQDKNLNNKLASFSFNNKKITNLEMETAGIYGLSKLLGHRAVSINAIIANRSTGLFSDNPTQTVDQLIQYTLDKIVQ